MPELVHSKLSITAQQRVMRIMSDVLRLREELTRAQVMSIYGHLEKTRDAISRILDEADGKNA